MNHVASFLESASLPQSASMKPGEHPVVKANAMATHMRAGLLFMLSFLYFEGVGCFLHSSLSESSRSSSMLFRAQSL